MRAAAAQALRTAAALAVLAPIAIAAEGASRFDPALRFRVLATEHFVIHFDRREERVARRLAVIAEETWRSLERPLGVRPPPLTRVVLADQTEFANGFATPLPYDTIVIYTVWPSGSEFVFDDWLRLAFTHEFTHIVHLDRSEGWARIARGIFGRTPYAFPNLYLPPWQIEGLATYEESAITGEGRLHAGDFRAIVGEAARRHALEPLDRVNGGLTDWPSSSAPYAYGVDFHAYLVDRFGAERLASLAAATARRFPYTSTRAFRYVYGESLGDLWRDYEASREAAAAAPAADQGLVRVTRDGFSVSGPRFDRFVCSGCPPAIFYAAANPRGFPSLARVALDGSSPRRVATRYLGSTSAIGPNTIYFDQVERRRNVGVYSDLYALSRTDGRVRALTSNARLRDPDLAPDGHALAAVEQKPGQRDLVVAPLRADGGVDRDSIAVLAGQPDAYFDAPRWSPDGRSIAVVHHPLGAMPEIVIVDAVTGRRRVVAAEPRTRFATPAWRPDGAALVVAAARGDETFNLFEVAVDGSPLRQLTHTSGGALWPDVSPDGRTIAFAGYTTSGYDVFTMPYPPFAAPREEGQRVVEKSPTGFGILPDPAEVRGYNPLATLKPTAWSPIIVADTDQIRVGAALSGVDVLGYHAYAADATWLISAPAGATTPAPASPDWSIAYAYDRWRPTVFATASSTTSFVAGPATAAGTPSSATRRERTVEAGVLLPFLHTRISHAALFSVLRSSNEYTLPASTVTRNVTPFRAAWETTTAKTYGYSISREDGVVLGATAEIVRRSVGSFADATTIAADARAYVRGARPHDVIALRLSGGSSTGDPTVGRTFLLGGSTADRGAIAFDSRASSLLRGFADATFAGSRVALVNAEYRFPLARPQRGVGTWPVFLHTISGAAFVDAGEAWTRAFRSSAAATSIGAELSAALVLGYFAPVTLTAGAAWGHDGGGAIANRASAYVRVGKAF